MSRSLALRSLCILYLFAAAIPAFASRPYVVEEKAVSKLRAGGQKLIVDDVPMFDGNLATVVLERFEVWAPNVEIIKYDANRKETRLPRPATKYYRGRISGDANSLVFISVEANGDINGMAFSGDAKRKLAIRRGVRATAQPGERGGARRDDGETPLMVREFDEVDDVTAFPEGGFHCDVEGQRMNIMRSLAELKPKPESSTPPTVTTGYGLNLAIETDGELRAAFASDAALTAYLGSLVGAASTIYQRDLKTTLTIGTTHIWADASTDPWTVLPASGTSAALAEFGNYWHANYLLVNRSSAVFISGKAFNGGIAWAGNQLCGPDFYCGLSGGSCGGATFADSYAGGYAFCGSTVITTTVPDPNATVGGVQYGLPLNNNFWMLLEVCHELGHNAAAPHTQCVPLDLAHQTTYGVIGRTFVDLCYNGDGGSCFAGTMDTPAEFGTIMSYCHNRPYVGGNIPSRYLFGKAGEPSELMPPYLTSALDAATPTVAITVGSGLPCAAGQTASVAAASSYAWQITGGTITSASNIASITFTPSVPSVVLTCTVSNTKGCAITSQLSTTSVCGALGAPTGVDAHATSTTNVQISWNVEYGCHGNIVRSGASGPHHSRLHDAQPGRLARVGLQRRHRVREQGLPLQSPRGCPEHGRIQRPRSRYRRDLLESDADRRKLDRECSGPHRHPQCGAGRSDTRQPGSVLVHRHDNYRWNDSHLRRPSKSSPFRCRWCADGAHGSWHRLHASDARERRGHLRQRHDRSPHRNAIATRPTACADRSSGRADARRRTPSGFREICRRCSLHRLRSARFRASGSRTCSRGSRP